MFTFRCNKETLMARPLHWNTGSSRLGPGLVSSVDGGGWWCEVMSESDGVVVNETDWMLL